MRSPVWLPDGKGLLFRFDDPDEHHRQIGIVSYPKGEFRRVSSDANHYDSALTMTADGRRVVCTVNRHSNRMSIVSLTSASTEAEIARGTLVDGLQWTPDGILASVDGRLVRISPDGRSENLVDETAFRVTQPRACGDDGVVYRHDSDGRASSIEWVSSNGAKRRPVTGEIEAKYPVCSPDGRSVFYDEHGRLFEMTANRDSSRLIPVTLSYQGGFEFAPDFKSILVTTIRGPELPHKHSWRWIDRATLRQIHEFSPVGAGGRGLVRFTPDGKNFAYVVEAGGVENLYMQPLDGTAGHFITSLPSRDALTNFTFAPDGRSVALLRAHRSADLVMIRQTAQ
jgi:Tol biopolymer transport system component